MNFKCLLFLFLGFVWLAGNTASVSAQKDETEPAKAELKKLAETEVKKHPLAETFYERFRFQEPDWELLYFYPPSPIEKDKDSWSFRFVKEKKSLRVFISKYKTAEGAESALNIPLNAIIKNYSKHGDEGRRVYGYGGFGNLSFRKGVFFVNVDCPSEEELATRVAGYALESIPR